MPDYQKGKIYKLTCNDNSLVYYGSTTMSLKKRLRRHNTWYNMKLEKGNCTSILLFDKGGVVIELVEKYPCDTRKELDKREGYYQLNNECVNKNIAGRSLKEWRSVNKDKLYKIDKRYREKNKVEIVKKKKIYYEANKEHIQKKLKKWRTNNRVKVVCDCGSSIYKYKLSDHIKTQKHVKYTNDLK